MFTVYSCVCMSAFTYINKYMCICIHVCVHSLKLEK